MSKSNRKNIRIADKQLGKKRRMLGLTQHQVAQATGISLNRLVFAETGRMDLEPDERAKVMQLLRQRARKVSAMVA
jgi:DNA-binding XRE family transcriptional regulator